MTFPETLKKELLANFADGDSWEAADSLSLTKHGALAVAEHFYAAGLKDSEGTKNGVERYLMGYRDAVEDCRKALPRDKSGDGNAEPDEYCTGYDDCIVEVSARLSALLPKTET